MRLEKIIKDNALDLFATSQATIVPIETDGVVTDRRRYLNGVRCAQTVTGPQFSRSIGQIHRQRDPLNPRVGAGQGKNLLSKFVLLLAIGLNQQFEKRHCRRNRSILLSLDQIEERDTSGSVSWMVLQKINEDVGVDADALAWERQPVGQRPVYHDRRSRLR